MKTQAQKKKKQESITLPSSRKIPVKVGDAFGGRLDELVVVAVGTTTLEWARPPVQVPKAEYAAARNVSTGRLSYLRIRLMQIDLPRLSEKRTAQAYRDLAETLGLRVKKAKAGR